MLFCQREEAETAVYLPEVASRDTDVWMHNTLDQLNGEHNDGLPRVALKMATGSGKTVVMAMLIALAGAQQGRRAAGQAVLQAISGRHARCDDP